MQTSSDKAVFYFGRLEMKTIIPLDLRMEQHLAAHTPHNDLPYPGTRAMIYFGQLTLPGSFLGCSGS
eukprot:scaffold457257_cov18-Prasinocladus_malaysianus.AAC.1